MKKNLLLTTLLALTLTACGKSAETTVEEPMTAIEAVVEESTIEEESTTEEETLSMTKEEIVAFLEQVRDMDYESYTFRRAQYFTDCLDSEGNPADDHTWEDTWISVDEDGNILFEEKQLTEGASSGDKTYNLVDDTWQKAYLLEDDTYATNDLELSDIDWDGFKNEDVKEDYLSYAKFFDLYSTDDEDIARFVVTEYNVRP